jgi:hypothetical protein
VLSRWSKRGGIDDACDHAIADFVGVREHNGRVGHGQVLPGAELDEIERGFLHTHAGNEGIIQLVGDFPDSGLTLRGINKHQNRRPVISPPTREARNMLGDRGPVIVG